jgi:hypothetical protein
VKGFPQNTTVTNKNGRFQIDCKKGLWGVDASSFLEATKEAMRYYVQYESDGEYDEGNDKLIAKLKG